MKILLKRKTITINDWTIIEDKKEIQKYFLNRVLNGVFKIKAKKLKSYL